MSVPFKPAAQRGGTLRKQRAIPLANPAGPAQSSRRHGITAAFDQLQLTPDRNSRVNEAPKEPSAEPRILPMRSSPKRPSRHLVGNLSRSFWLAMGFVFVALGFIGALLPLMPTTIFLILAVGCFARSSPRLETWLLDHPRFGPTLRAWRAEGAIGPRAKIMACSGIALGYALFWWGARPTILIDLVVAAIMASCAAFIISRPKPRTPTPAVITSVDTICPPLDSNQPSPPSAQERAPGSPADPN